MDIDIESGSSPSIIGNELSIGAIWMEGADVNPVIRENVLNDSVKWGVSIGAGARPVVLDNTIVNAQTGIDISEDGFLTGDVGTDALVRGNTISGASGTGIVVGDRASATIEGNTLRDNSVGISTQGVAIVEGNRIEGGGSGIVVMSGLPSLVDNIVEGQRARGIVVTSGASPILRGNTSCDKGENLRIVDGATPDIDDTNEICEDAPAPSE